MNESRRKGICCYYCRRKFSPVIKKTKDHLVAKDLGGFDIEENYVDCCFDCNQWKGNKTLEQWLAIVQKWLVKGNNAVYTNIELGQMVGSIKKLIKEIKDKKDISTYKPK